MEISTMQKNPQTMGSGNASQPSSADQNAAGTTGAPEFKDDLSQQERNIMKHSSIV